MDRREFLGLALAAGGGLLLGFEWEPAEAATRAFAPNAYLRVDPDGTVTVLVPRAEMGQGVYTALPALVAEELACAWDRVRVEAAPAAAVYRDQYGLQITSGSTSVRDLYMPLRQAGAAARQMLVGAAAAAWGVPAAQCRASGGFVLHEATGRRAAFGALAAQAARQPVPGRVDLGQGEFTLIGKPLPRTDTHPKITGKATFGLDVRPAGHLVARLAMPPEIGGKLKGLGSGAARKVPGVCHVLRLKAAPGTVPGDAVAVVADSYPAAGAGVEALRARWGPGPLHGVASDGIEGELRAAARKGGVVARRDGDAERAIAAIMRPKSPAGRRVLAAEFWLPYLAHATMEPPNCTAHVHAGGVDVWIGTQAQSEVQKVAARVAGVPESRVRVHTTLLGCGFGRRLETDFAAQAVAIAKRVGKPVKLIWSREDDLGHDAYRPASLHRLRAALDRDGSLVAWSHKLVSPSIYRQKAPEWLHDGIDETAVEGAAGFPYAVPHVLVRHVAVDPGIPLGYWRSVGFSSNAFAVEVFMDQVARAVARDPVAFRLSLLRATAPRLARVLEIAAREAGWGAAVPAGRHRGVAVCASYGSFVAQVAEVSVKEGRPRVHRVTCAIDCGQVINPGIVEAQMQGGIVFGLSAALHGQIGFAAGRVLQTNFDSYPVLRMSETPEIAVHIVPSREAPGGVGEPGVPPIAPAVANALAAAGHVVRRLPIRLATR
ncbi:MAG: xanthine dehydrogenase family protein molybdopterin-binding subunit [Candidatus Sericytochromatia bacterium]|nr:xanthine dehydrogenase family protein molybdopterin-binding subunit [Candidatus Tanganyikabacteria bacterium]